MPRSVPRSLVIAAPLALAACGSAVTGNADKAPAGESAKETAPAGVAHQRTVLEAEFAARGGVTKTGPMVPNVPIRPEVVDAKDEVAQVQDLNSCHAETFHYADNFSVPTGGTYTLRATPQRPTFLRRSASGEKPALSEAAKRHARQRGTEE
ncbi:hypothetical protein [Streptomyces justiciae]|uniref:hypothetical protein n=1 Tax=Streptomyces justiciae TaxID=2780140 RepID=UPI001882CDFF|nr:hypothetical protein [Streptomyces justiciae]MBE8476051.1 hypothetical protein [Streptomyces justiciae]